MNISPSSSGSQIRTTSGLETLKNIVNALNADLKKAWSTVSDIESETMYHGHSDENPTLAASYDYLEYVNRGIYIKLCIALKFVGAVEVLEDLRSSINSSKRLNAVYMPYGSDSLACGTTTELSQYIEAVEAMLNPGEADHEVATSLEILKLRNFLLETPRIIRDFGLEPRSEKDVREKVYNVLIHLHPDTVREIPISKVSKVYKPDIGVRSLKAAIEYKYVTSETELKTAIGGVFEDISGYAGSADWTTFFAVFYMTDAFFTQRQIDSEFQLSNAPHSWIPILVLGKGERPKKAKSGKAERDVEEEQHLPTENEESEGGSESTEIGTDAPST